jgi:hypothetical protein
MKSSSSSHGTGVVALEGCGVDGGASGSVYWLVDIGLLKKSDAVGNTNEAVGEGISASSADGEAGRNCPREFRRIGLASVADARLATRRSRRQIPNCMGKRMSAEIGT